MVNNINNDDQSNIIPTGSNHEKELSVKTNHSGIPPEVSLQTGVTIEWKTYKPSLSQMVWYYSRRITARVNQSKNKVKTKIIKNDLRTLDEGEVYNYDDTWSTKIMSIDRDAMCIVDTHSAFHLFSVERGSYLFIKPGCPSVACNSLERGSKIYVPEWTPVFLGSKESGEVIEYDPSNMENTLELAKKNQEYYISHPLAKMKEDKVERKRRKNSSEITEGYTSWNKNNIVFDTEGLVNIHLVDDGQKTFDVTDKNFPFIHTTLNNRTELKIWSSTEKRISVFIESINHDSTLICDHNVEEIYVKYSPNGKNTIKCSKSCNVHINDRLVNVNPHNKTLTIERGNFDNEIDLKILQIEKDES